MSTGTSDSAGMLSAQLACIPYAALLLALKKKQTKKNYK